MHGNKCVEIIFHGKKKIFFPSYLHQAIRGGGIVRVDIDIVINSVGHVTELDDPTGLANKVILGKVATGKPICLLFLQNLKKKRVRAVDAPYEGRKGVCGACQLVTTKSKNRER